MFGKNISILNWPLQVLECVFQHAKNSRNFSSQVSQLLGRAMWNFKSWSWMLRKSSLGAWHSTEVMANVLLAWTRMGTSLGLFFSKVHREVQIPVALVNNKKNSKENKSCTPWNVKIDSVDCSPKLSIRWKAEDLIFFLCDSNTLKIAQKPDWLVP